MTTATLAGFFRALGATLTAPGNRKTPVSPRRGRRIACSAIAWFAVVVVGMHAAVFLALDHTWPHLRDPEYSRRTARLRDRLSENPGRPLALMVGSSRTAMGVRPGEWEEARPNVPGRPDPMLFNISLLGSGPMMELMVLRRVYADGFRPELVLLEYWPPFLYSEEIWFEPNRVAADRLMAVDEPLIRGYFPFPDVKLAEMRRCRTNPIFANRDRLLAQLIPNWVPPLRRPDGGWTGLDPWGWLPGVDVPPGPSERRDASLSVCHAIYQPLFARYRISPDSDRAVREAVALAREHGSTVGFVWLPEASEFRGWYTPEAERLGREHLARLSGELAVPVIDARTWIDDGMLVDGFHLSRVGAAEFTRKFGPAVAETFPDLRVRPQDNRREPNPPRPLP